MIKQRENTGERRNDIIDLVLDEMKNSSLSEDFSNDEKELILIANALVLFFAGFDSTAIGLSKVALQLIKNPDIQDKVFEEIEDVLGDDDVAAAAADATAAAEHLLGQPDRLALPEQHGAVAPAAQLLPAGVVGEEVGG